MFSPYAFYFPWFLYFLLTKDCSFIRLVLALANNVFPRFQKRQMEKKILFIFLTCSLLVIYESSIKCFCNSFYAKFCMQVNIRSIVY